MDQVKTEFLESQVYKPLVWFRYFRNSFLFGLWSRKAQVNFRRLKQVSPYIKFTHEINKEDIAFLDLTFKLLDGKIFTYQFVKSTDRHQLLHYTSSHPEHNKRSKVFRKSLIVRICSYESDFCQTSWHYKIMVFGNTLQICLRVKEKKLSLLLILIIGTKVNFSRFLNLNLSH